MNKVAVILISGGLDSTTCAAIANKAQYELHGITINYGQKHEYELRASRKIANYLKLKSHEIIDIELKMLFERITQLGYSLSLDKKAKDFIADKGYDSQFGARPLKRAIQKYLEDVIAEEIVNANLEEGDDIKISLDEEKGELKVKINKPKKEKPQKPKKEE